MARETATDRIIFAHILRGSAALLVVLHHFTTVMWASPWAIENVLNMPAANFAGSLVATLQSIDAILRPVFLDFRHWSALGVALFFLISGFVIPFAVTRTDRKSFLLGRFWRLWPVYCSGLVLVLAVLTLTSALAGRPVPFHAGMIAAHLAFAWDFFTPTSYDAVSWTLVIEVRFYILCALLLPLLRRGDIYSLAFTGAVLMAGAALVGLWGQYLPPDHPWPGIALGRTLSIIVFMLIGIAFNFHHRGCIGTGQLVLSCLWFFILFCGAYLMGPWSRDMQDYSIVYGYALLLFALAYATRHAWRSPAWLNGLARISYPLYIVHAIVGYALINSLVMQGATPALAFGAALLAVFGVAWIIHRWVEMPAMDYAHRLTRRSQIPQTL
ncbi:MAG: acyltransferase [Alphaproteobacteria bacterium]